MVLFQSEHRVPTARWNIPATGDLDIAPAFAGEFPIGRSGEHRQRPIARSTRGKIELDDGCKPHNCITDVERISAGWPVVMRIFRDQLHAADSHHVDRSGPLYSVLALHNPAVPE